MSTWAWMSGPIFARRPRGQHERLRRQRAQRVLLDRVEHRGRGRAVERAAGPPPRCFQRPAGALGLHLLQRRELASPPERVADIRHRPLDPGLVAGPDRPGRVDQAPVVPGELGIRAVQLRVVEVGLVDPGLQVVGHQPGRDAAEELERQHVALRPGPLVHLQHGADEHVPRAGQDHDERPDDAELPGRRVEPAAEDPVVDLRLLPGLGRPRVPDRHLRPAGLLRHVRRHVTPEARHARGQAVLVAQPLVDRRHPHPGLQLRGHVLVVHRDRRPRHLPQPHVRQLREPLPDQLVPLGLAPRRPLHRLDPRGHGRGDVLADRLAVHPQRAGHLVQRPASVPVHEYLGHVDHVERSPCHRPPVPDGRQGSSVSMARSTTTRTPSPWGIT